MSDNIRISPDIMRQRAGQYRNEAATVGQTISNMDNLLNLLQSEWEGQSSQAYAQRYYSELKPNFQKAKELIEEIAVALDKTAASMEDIDNDIANKLR